jgi:hypothetical protein
MEKKQLTKQQLTFCLIMAIVLMAGFGVGLFKYNINGMVGIFIYPVMLSVKEISKEIFPAIKPKE